MKKITVLLLSLLLVTSAFCQQTIVVKNNSGLDRKGEMIEVKLADKLADFKTKSFVLKNQKNQEVAYQLIKNGKKTAVSFVFQVDIVKNTSNSYTLTDGTPASVKGKTSARFVPERKDDLSWENDLAAYRMYGPALAKENPSNGVDLWLKCTSDLITDKFYRDELQNGLSYHVNRGQGLDCYTVGHTLGVGGIAPFVGDSLWVGNHYDHYKILEKGPLRSTFVLTYDSVKVGNDFYQQELTITCDAGSMLNKGVVKFTGKEGKLPLAAGIFLHDGKGNLKLDAVHGLVAYAEEAISNAKVPEGRNYVGVMIPGKKVKAQKHNVHGLLISNYTVGKKFTYYFGGGWNKWGYPTDNDWFTALEQFAARQQSPLEVTIQ